MSETIAVDEVEYVEDLYPRIEVDEATVSRYRGAIDDLPPIKISQDKKLIDGYHRLRAYRIEGKEEIEAEIVEVEDDEELYIKAIQHNATHGLQLSKEEKKKLARELYRTNGHTQDDIAGIVGMSKGWVSGKLKDIRQEEREERRDKSFELYLDYLNYPTQKDVAEELDVTERTVRNDIGKKFKSEDFSSESDSISWFNVLRFRQPDSDYGTDGWAGRIPGQIVENFLYHYTEPKDLVVDPMAGGGTTVDVCKRWGRRYAAFDLNPLEDKNIQQYDAGEEWPLDDSVADAVFLDPPYWNLMDDDYVEGSNSAKDYDDWLEFMNHVANECNRVTGNGGKVALLLMAMEDERGDGDFRDLVVDSTLEFRDAGYTVEQRFSAPMTTEVKSGRDVKFAKENGKVLSINRDLVIYGD